MELTILILDSPNCLMESVHGNSLTEEPSCTDLTNNSATDTKPVF